MKKKRVLLSLLLVLTTLLSALLPSCSGNTAVDTEEQNATSAIEEVSTAEEKQLLIISEGKCHYAIVRPDELKSDNPAVVAATEIRALLSKKCTESVTIKNDFLMPGESHDPEAYEILFGETNYDESKSLTDALNPGEYIIKAVGNKIIVCGNTDTAMENALDEFKALLKAGTSDDGTIKLNRSDLDVHKSEVRLVKSLPAIDNVEFESFYTSNKDCDEAIYKKATREAFDAYVKKLRDAGYKQYAANEMNGNAFATLYTEKTTVNVGFYVGEKKIRIIAEPYSEETLYGAEPEGGFKQVTTPLLTMLGLMYQGNDGSNVNTGACFVMRLSDGRFIVTDGGHNRSIDMKNICDLVIEQSKDYIKEGEKPVIAAWVITHPHTDHWGPLKNHGNMLNTMGIKLECIIFNEMSQAEYDKAYVQEKWSVAVNGLDRVAAVLNCPIIVPHVGQVYHYGGVTMEILFTIESLGPAVPNDANHISLIQKYTITDPVSGEKTVFMANGDATGAAFRQVALNFGDYLLCDIAQISHHGASTKGDNPGTIMAYKKMLPKTVLWTSGDGAYTAYAANDYNAAMVSAAVNVNFKEVYVSSSSGKRTILTFPYRVGTATVID